MSQKDAQSNAGDNVGNFNEEEANKKRQNREEGVSKTNSNLKETPNCLSSRPSEKVDYQRTS